MALHLSVYLRAASELPHTPSYPPPILVLLLLQAREHALVDEVHGTHVLPEEFRCRLEEVEARVGVMKADSLSYSHSTLQWGEGDPNTLGWLDTLGHGCSNGQRVHADSNDECEG